MILSIDSVQGQVKIGNPPELLPGILSNISINGELLIENVPIEGRSGTAKQVHGWSDAACSISLILLDDSKKTRFDYLADIVKLFKKEKNGIPVIYNLQHPMVKAWNIKQLLYSKLQTTEEKEKNKIIATLEFVEDNPVVGISQERKDVAPEEENETQQTTGLDGTINSDQKYKMKEVEARFHEYI